LARAFRAATAAVFQMNAAKQRFVGQKNVKKASLTPSIFLTTAFPQPK
jgi:hypothetical protein